MAQGKQQFGHPFAEGGGNLGPLAASSSSSASCSSSVPPPASASPPAENAQAGPQGEGGGTHPFLPSELERRAAAFDAMFQNWDTVISDLREKLERLDVTPAAKDPAFELSTMPAASPGGGVLLQQQQQQLSSVSARRPPSQQGRLPLQPRPTSSVAIALSPRRPTATATLTAGGGSHLPTGGGGAGPSSVSIAQRPPQQTRHHPAGEAASLWAPLATPLAGPVVTQQLSARGTPAGGPPQPQQQQQQAQAQAQQQGVPMPVRSQQGAAAQPQPSYLVARCFNHVSPVPSGVVPLRHTSPLRVERRSSCPADHASSTLAGATTGQPLVGRRGSAALPASSPSVEVRTTSSLPPQPSMEASVPEPRAA